MSPTPDTWELCGLPTPEPAMRVEPLGVPAAAGVNVMPGAHVALPAKTEQTLVAILNSVGAELAMPRVAHSFIGTLVSRPSRATAELPSADRPGTIVEPRGVLFNTVCVSKSQEPGHCTVDGGEAISVLKEASELLRVGASGVSL